MEYCLCKTKEGELTKNPWEVNLPDDFKDNVAFHKELLRFAKLSKTRLMKDACIVVLAMFFGIGVNTRKP